MLAKSSVIYLKDGNIMKCAHISHHSYATKYHFNLSNYHTWIMIIDLHPPKHWNIISIYCHKQRCTISCTWQYTVNEQISYIKRLTWFGTVNKFPVFLFTFPSCPLAPEKTKNVNNRYVWQSLTDTSIRESHYSTYQ